jgi:hypothetical protein
MVPRNSSEPVFLRDILYGEELLPQLKRHVPTLYLPPINLYLQWLYIKTNDRCKFENNEEYDFLGCNTV